MTGKSIKDHVAGKVRFSHYRKGNLYYTTDSGLTFPVPIDDCGDATFAAEDKGLLFMRYIRKALEDQRQEIPALYTEPSTEKPAVKAAQPECEPYEKPGGANNPENWEQPNYGRDHGP